MSHDRGCPCGREGQDEYNKCTQDYCGRRPETIRIPEWAQATPADVRDQRAKADGGKTQPGLLLKDMAPAVYLVNRVLDYGMEKYARGSWRNVEHDRWDEAQRRHQQAIDMGERNDAESGMLHRAHQIAGLIIMLMHELDTYPENIQVLGTYNPPPQEHKHGL
ncbi:hypothetical protein [Rhizobium phage RHEph15]|uniref:dATP/dGTP diphosphohydrolase N-terminal domain-containing protein n=1 Tax=Rhizobium phage RHph_TM34 TaxID=2509556 RepID=A0A7S5QVR8_9CAUD|nr:hypothetical protein EVB35_018 [Rhizobium phage RHph_TM34]QXV74279.1 hypothetical protein [Rhizobium phage RHEph15]QXV74973.1 hypothetical protein [Rhizobium phage RHEph27]